jgi:DNA polymerase-1
VLATIRTDAPVAFIEPEMSFIETLDMPKLVGTFTEFGFRSLVPRAQSLALKPAVPETGRDDDAPRQQSLSVVATVPDGEEELFCEAAAMLWLSQSDITNPTVDDVLNNTKSKTITEAHGKLKALLAEKDLLEVYEKIEKPLIPVIRSINEHGVLIDREYLLGLSKEYHRELDKLAAKIFVAAGGEFNINSPKQLGEVLFTKMGLGSTNKRQKKTSTGQLSTKESELTKLKGEHEIIDLILSHRELQKLLSTYIDAIPPLLKADGRLHTTFIQTGTTTGRLSSQDPNLQNIPTKSELGKRIRTAFIAPHGSVLATFDYSQIELRLAALLSGDEKLADIFRAGLDVHAAVAARVFGVKEEDVTKEQRRRAKVINFGILYGMGVNALKESLGTDREEAQAFYNRYFETFSTLAEYLAKTKASALRLGYTTTYFGRRRYFPGIKSKLPYVRAQAERMAINAPLQGTQSDIVKIAMVKIHTVLKEKYGDKASLVLQIHDELMFEVEKSILHDVAKDVRSAMQDVLTPKEMNGIPLIVSSEAGPNWGAMEKI